MQNKQQQNNLWEDFLALGEKYSDQMPLPNFGARLICYISKMFYDTAPSFKDAEELIQHAINEAKQWHLEEQQESE